jgi:hypothetical protein
MVRRMGGQSSPSGIDARASVGTPARYFPR